MRMFAVLAAGLLLVVPAQADSRWTGSWATSRQIPEDRNVLPAHALDDATLRQSVHLSIQGQSLRVRLSNAFGTMPLHIARALANGSDTIEVASDMVLHFSGAADVAIPAGAEYLSDPVQLAGADFSGDLHGSKRSYPNWPTDDPKIVETARYFDAVNFAPAIKAESLVALGFIDTTSPPFGVFSAFNRIQGPKEAVPMPESDHNNVTPQQEGDYYRRSKAVLDQLRTTGHFTPDPDWAKN